jgi:hypothetical protein
MSIPKKETPIASTPVRWQRLSLADAAPKINELLTRPEAIRAMMK